MGEDRWEIPKWLPNVSEIHKVDHPDEVNRRLRSGWLYLGMFVYREPSVLDDGTVLVSETPNFIVGLLRGDA